MEALAEVPIDNGSNFGLFFRVGDPDSAQLDDGRDVIPLLAADVDQRLVQLLLEACGEQYQFLHLSEVEVHKQPFQDKLLLRGLVLPYDLVQHLLAHVRNPQAIPVLLLDVMKQFSQQDGLELVVLEEGDDFLEEELGLVALQQEVDGVVGDVRGVLVLLLDDWQFAVEVAHDYDSADTTHFCSSIAQLLVDSAAELEPAVVDLLITEESPFPVFGLYLLIENGFPAEDTANYQSFPLQAEELPILAGVVSNGGEQMLVE